MPLTTIDRSPQVRPVLQAAQLGPGRSGCVIHARIVPPATQIHGPRTRGATGFFDQGIAADGAEEGNS